MERPRIESWNISSPRTLVHCRVRHFKFRYNEYVKILRLVGILSILIVSSGIVSPARAQDSNERYFPETGHNLKDDFLRFYESNPDALTLYGYPITEAYTNKQGLFVQYFQRARFELHPERPAGSRVQLSPIGRETYTPAPALNVYNSLDCRYFGNEYPVCFAFLDFYQRYGGVAQFGKPISSFESRDQLIVQSFENARFEWKPWLPEGQRVVISDLGKIHFYGHHEDVNLLKPVLRDPIGGPNIILSLKTRAFAWKATTLINDQQLIFVVVQDQTLLPVSGAVGTATIRWPSGSAEEWPFVSNSNGIGIIPLSVKDQPYGNLVYVDISVSYGAVGARSTTSFRIWY